MQDWVSPKEVRYQALEVLDTYLVLSRDFPGRCYILITELLKCKWLPKWHIWPFKGTSNRRCTESSLSCCSNWEMSNVCWFGLGEDHDSGWNKYKAKVTLTHWWLLTFSFSQFITTTTTKDHCLAIKVNTWRTGNLYGHFSGEWEFQFPAQMFLQLFCKSARC